MSKYYDFQRLYNNSAYKYIFNIQLKVEILFYEPTYYGYINILLGKKQNKII